MPGSKNKTLSLNSYKTVFSLVNFLRISSRFIKLLQNCQRNNTYRLCLYYLGHIPKLRYTESLIIKTNKCTNVYCIILKHTLKHLKSSYMFRSIDHHQGAYVVPCWSMLKC
jgi:hypothetical protein